jgi:hypothetical protein
MLARLLVQLRQQWMGALALFLVLTGGVAYAANTVFSEDIVNGEVKSVDIGNNQVRSADVRDDTLAGGGLTAADLDPSAFFSGDIARSGVGGVFEIPTNAIQSVEVSDNSLTGADVNEGSLSVANLGCQAGLILGFARVKGDSSMPSTYTSSSTFVDTKRNCSGGSVEVRRSLAGSYQIRFNGISTQLGLGSALDSPNTLCTDNFVSVTKLPGFDGASEFHVYSRDNDGDLQDCWVTVAAI